MSTVLTKENTERNFKKQRTWFTQHFNSHYSKFKSVSIYLDNCKSTVEIL